MNYAPFGSGGHMATRRELMMEWGQLFPRPGPEFDDMTQLVGLDAFQSAPTNSVDIQQIYDHYVLGDPRYTKKGQFMKQSSWYSILNLIDKYDRVWHAHKFLAQQVADRLGKRMTGKIARELLGEAIVPVGPSDSGAIVAAEPAGKESYLAELRKLRKKAGNAVLLVPMLMNDRNLVNARIMLLVGRPAAHD